jgi:hypothetical protein
MSQVVTDLVCCQQMQTSKLDAAMHTNSDFRVTRFYASGEGKASFQTPQTE